MGITLTEHVKRKILDRAIREHVIFDCIQNPDSFAVGQWQRYILQKRLNSKVLRVVIEKIEDEIIVITAYEARAKRYEL